MDNNNNNVNPNPNGYPQQPEQPDYAAQYNQQPQQPQQPEQPDYAAQYNQQQALNKCFSNESLVNKNYKEYYMQLILNAKNHPFSETWLSQMNNWGEGGFNRQ